MYYRHYLMSSTNSPSCPHTALVLHGLECGPVGASPMAEWLSLHVPLRWPRFVGSDPECGTTHCSSSHAVSASHIEELEGLRTSIYNYVLGLWGEGKKKEEDWQQKLAWGQSSSPKSIPKKKKECGLWSPNAWPWIRLYDSQGGWLHLSKPQFPSL